MKFQIIQIILSTYLNVLFGASLFNKYKYPYIIKKGQQILNLKK